MATSNYANVTKAYIALGAEIDHEYLRLNFKNDLSEDEEAYLEQLGAARKNIYVLLCSARG